MDYLDHSKRINICDIMEMDYCPKPGAMVPEYTIKEPERPNGQGVGHYGEMTTVIDRVYDYIIKREVTSTKELADKLGIRQAQVEKMVEMLEASRLIKLKYSVVPNGNIDVLVVNSDSETVKKKEVSNEEKTKGLKIVIMSDIDKLESAISSMEHHLNTWSSEAEERTVVEGPKSVQAVSHFNQESAKIERALEHVRADMSTRLSIVKKRLGDMRTKINDNGKKSPEQPGGMGSILGIKNPFNF